MNILKYEDNVIYAKSLVNKNCYISLRIIIDNEYKLKRIYVDGENVNIYQFDREHLLEIQLEIYEYILDLLMFEA